LRYIEGFENGAGTVVDVILDAVQLVTNSQMEALRNGGLTYYRLEPSLTQAQSNMANYKVANVNSLMATANAYLKGDGAKALADIVTALKNN